MDGMLTVAAIEATLVQFVDQQVHDLESRPTKTYDLFEETDEKPVNNLMFRVPVRTRWNGNVGGGDSGSTGYREPGSAKRVAMLFQSIERHISGGVKQNTIDQWKKSGASLGGSLANEIQSDFESLSKDRNRGLHRGNSGARGTVDTANGAVTLAAGQTSFGLDDKFGCKHLEEETYYEIYDPATGTRRGVAGGYFLDHYDRSAKLVYFDGDLTAIGIADGDILVPPSLYNADCDGLPEIFGDSGPYAGRDADEEWQQRAQRINAAGGLVGLAILEKLDARMQFIDGDYDGSQCVIITTATLESQYKELGYAQVGNQTPTGTFKAGYRDVMYKDRRMILDPDGDPSIWYRANMQYIRRYTHKKRGLFGKEHGQSMFVRRSGSSLIGAWQWVIEEKTNVGTHGRRRQGLIYGFDISGSETGHA